MASAISHALVGAALGLLCLPGNALSTTAAVQPLAPHGGGPEQSRLSGWRLPLVAALAAVCPDLDVVMHAFVAYSHPLGHRGAFHSAAFYALCALGGAVAWGGTRAWRGRIFVCLLLAMLSHSLLDMCTDGGLGIALFWPLSAERWFFPWRFIPVSPLSLAAFFSQWGVEVLKVELLFSVPAFALAWWWRALRARGVP